MVEDAYHAALTFGDSLLLLDRYFLTAETIRAIEMHMALSCIAMGILQSLSIRFIGKISSSQVRYQRQWDSLVS